MSNYEILQIQPGASIEDIKRAYRKLAMIHHPDQGGDVEMFKKINTAYTNLLNGARNSSPKYNQYDENDDVFTAWKKRNDGFKSNLNKQSRILKLNIEISTLTMQRNKIDSQLVLLKRLLENIQND